MIAMKTLLTVVTMILPTAGGDDPAPAERLRTEGPLAWTRLEAGQRLISVSCSEVTRTIQPGENENEADTRGTLEYQWQLDRDERQMLRFTKLVNKQTLNTVIIGTNQNYALMVAADTDPGRYKLIDCDRHGRQPDGPEALNLLETDRLAAVRSGYQIYGIPLTEIVADDNFKIQRVTQHERPGGLGPIVRVEAVYQGESEQPRMHGALYWAELDPDQSWVALRGGIQDDNSGLIREQTTSYQNRDGLPFPETAVLRAWRGPNDPIEQAVYQFEPPTIPHRDAREFYLPFYGIPESVLGFPPDQPAPKSLHPAIIAAWTLAGLSAAALIVTLRRGRLQKPAA